MPLGTGTPGSGIPENDPITASDPETAAFLATKRAVRDALVDTNSKSPAKAQVVPMTECEFDPPCEPPNPPPLPPGTPTSKILDTRGRQQINNYYCGPAAGQVIINYTRGISVANLSEAGAKDTTINWKLQPTIATWMRTTTEGTGGATLAQGLNNSNGVVKPVPEWVYSYDPTGSLETFHRTVVTDVHVYGMPLVLATRPHQSGAGQNFLMSWPNIAHGVGHWITLRGYNGLWGSSSPRLYYNDSSGGYGGGTGAFSDLVSVLWQVNVYNKGGNIVW